MASETPFQRKVHDNLLKMSAKELKGVCKEVKIPWKGNKEKTIADIFNNWYELEYFFFRKDTRYEYDIARKAIENTNLSQEEKEKCIRQLQSSVIYLE